LFIKRLILGLDVTFPGNSLWAFVDTSNGALNYSHPLPYKDSILITNLLSDKMNQDFVGVKLGDVNFDWNGNVARPAQPSSSVVTFYYDDVTVKEGNEIRVPVRVRNFKNVLGMQFTLNFNNQSLRFERIENNRLKILCAYNRAEEGKLPFIWSDDKNSLVSLNDDEVLLELVFTERSAFTQEDIGVTSDITNIELWDGNYIRHNIIKGKGKINKKDVPAITGESWEVSPNPTKGTIKVDLYSLKENHISIELLNAEGVVLLKKNLLSGRGINLINLDLRQNQDLPAGVYYLKISGINDVRVKKVLLL